MNSITHFNPVQMLNDLIEDTASNIQKYCKNPGKDFVRNRKLSIKTLLAFMFKMEGNSISKEIEDNFPITKTMTASAFVQQRAKLKPEAFQHMLHRTNELLPRKKNFKGYDIIAIDGTDFYYPANPKSKNFIKRNQIRKDGEEIKSYCLLHANIIYDVLNKRYIDCITGPRNGFGGDERFFGEKFIDKHIRDRQIVIMDRGYISYNLIEHGNRSGGYYIIRSTVKKASSIPEIGNLPDKEYDGWFNIKITPTQKKKYLENGYRSLEIIKKGYKPKEELSDYQSRQRRKRWDFEEAVTVNFRAVKVKINDEGNDQWEVLITNIPSNLFTADDLRMLYGKRWGIEISFRSLKYAVGAIQFHSRQDDFVLQEIYSKLVLFNITAAAGNEIEIPNKIYQKLDYAIDFKMSVVLVRKFFKEKIDSAKMLFCQMLKYTQAIRPGRKDPRKIIQRSPVYFVYRVA